MSNKRRVVVAALIILGSIVVVHTAISASNKDAKLFFKKPVKAPTKTYIKIYKGKRMLELYGDEVLLGRFKIALGKKPEGHKSCEGDSKTPEGKYYVCTRNDKSKFHLFLGLSYPGIMDADRALKDGIIDKNTCEIIKQANLTKSLPPWNTPLGGAIGIHGGGTKRDWTAGCIAVSNKDIRKIWRYTSLKTDVYIYP